jgi:FkbH-like protein
MYAMDYLTLLDEVNKLQQQSYTQTLRMAILRNYTVENLVPYLGHRFMSRGIGLDCRIGGYNNVRQELLDPGSLVYDDNHLIAVCLTAEEFTAFEGLGSADAETVIREVTEIIDKLLADTSSLIVFSLFMLPFHRETGIANAGDSVSDKVNAINAAILSYTRSHPARFFAFDVNRILGLVGEEKAMDYRYWYSAKAPFRHDFLLHQAAEVARIGYALLGKNRKCLVLDCDNTLWKGIIGEDGINGIKLDKDSSPGNLFYNFQKTVVQLHGRGVIIALNSKNNEQDVLEVLDRHPSCLIRRNHLATYRVNWNNKVDNLKEIAEELNIGLDYFVFVDDNPVECAWVKEQLPMVEVIQVPQKLYLYPDVLLRDGLFDTLTVSEEDKKRNALYQVETRRRESRQQFTDITEYLRSLDIRLSIGDNALVHIGRLAQLTQKTNQFNLTTRRFSEEEMKAWISRGGKVYYFGVEDKFGDMGITGLMMTSSDGDTAHIENFLLSCRILGRNIEKAFVQYCLSELFEIPGISRVTTSFVASSKNMQTREFWESAGFAVTAQSDTGKDYELRRSDYTPVTYDYIAITTIAS